VAAVGLQLKADAEGDRTAGEGIGTMRELRAPHLDRLRRKDAYIVDLPAAGEAAIEARDRTRRTNRAATGLRGAGPV
jgi:hypothetical protein